MRSVDERFYNSKKWRKVAAAYKQERGGLCERCKAKGIYRPADIVHHKTHLTHETVKNARIAYGFDNLEALCIDCHNLEHFGRKRERRRYQIANDGSLLI